MATVSSNKVTGQKVYIKSYGCQMNVYDATRMADALASDGFRETRDVDEADLVVLNTCHIREKASEKVYSELGRMKQLKEQRAGNGRNTLIAVAGCVAQADGAEIIRRQPAVDIVIGTQAYNRLPEAVRRARRESGVVFAEFDGGDKFANLPSADPQQIQARGVSAFVTVQEGCDKFCSFCVVPYTRGLESSRTVAGIEDEVARLVDGGVREVVLLGQNVNAYHGLNADGRETSLAGLIEALSRNPRLLRIRYTTSHPRDMATNLIEAHRDVGQLMPYIHLPVQSGSDRMLASMNRKHRASDYLAVIERMRAARPDIAFSSDFIVGAPGETRHDFEATLRLVREVGFASAYSFKYSARPGTPASIAADQVDEQEKSERLAELQDLLESQRRAFNATFVGRRVPVLFEKRGRHAGQIVGKSP